MCEPPAHHQDSGVRLHTCVVAANAAEYTRKAHALVAVTRTMPGCIQFGLYHEEREEEMRSIRNMGH